MTPTIASQAALADLTDAVVRGRLCIAEVADISAEEQNALFEAAVNRLRRGQAAQAVVLMRALTSLYPYAARFWRGLGVALNHTQALQQAAAAYLAALVLQPGHPLTVCYLGEVQVQLGDTEAGTMHLTAASHSDDPLAAGRASLMLQALQGAPPVQPEPPAITPEVPTALSTADQFTLTDGRVLPLQESRFTDTQTDIQAMPTHAPMTERRRTAALPSAPRDVTDTAIVPRPGPKEPAGAAPQSITGTAKIDRRQLAGAAKPPMASALRRRRRGDPLSQEITLPAVERDIDRFEP